MRVYIGIINTAHNMHDHVGRGKRNEVLGGQVSGIGLNYLSSVFLFLG
jgi:hypothetical protein